MVKLSHLKHVPFLVLFVILVLLSLDNARLFHPLVEFLMIIAGYGVFVTVWNARKVHPSSFFLMIGVAFFSVTLWDLLHFLSHEGMPFYQGHGDTLPSQLKMVSDFVFAASLFLAMILVRRSLNAIRVLSLYGAFSLILLCSIFYWEIFPVCYTESGGDTFFRKVSDLVATILLMGTFFMSGRARMELNRIPLRLFRVFLALVLMSEFSFALPVNNLCHCNVAGHLLRLSAYYLLYLGLVDVGLERPYLASFESLKESEERNRLLLSSAFEGIYSLDIAGRCTMCNASAVRMLGYKTEEEVLGKSMHDLIHHSLPNGELFAGDDCTILSAVITGEGVHSDVEVFWRKDGSHFPVEYWSYPVVRGEKVIGVVVTFIDITGRLEAEKRVLRSRRELGQRVRELDCLNGIARLVEDPGTTEDGICQGAARLIPSSLRHPEIASCRLSMGQEVFVSEGLQESDWRLSADISVNGRQAGMLEVFYREERPERDEGPFTSDERALLNAVANRLGESFERLQAVRALKDSHEMLEVKIGERTAELKREIDVRIMAEEGLRARTEELEKVLDTVPDLYFRLLSDGSINECRASQGAGICEPPEDCVGRRLSEVLSSDVASQLEGAVARVARSGRSETAGYSLEASGAKVYYEARIFRFKADEVIMLVRDITLTKQAENSIKQANALMDAITRMQSMYISKAPWSEISEVILRELIMLSSSQYGYIAELGRGGTGEVLVKNCAVINDPDGEGRAIYQDLCGGESDELYDEESLLGQVLVGGKPYLTNDLTVEQVEAGLPEGSGELRSFVGIPLYSGGEICGLLALAGSSGAYDEEGVMRFAPIFNAISNIFVSNLNECERIKAEKELQEIFSLSFDMICISDSERFLRTNPAFARVLGYSEEELLDIPMKDLIHCDDLQATLEVMDAGNGGVLQYENRFIGSDGVYRWLEWTSHRTPEEGLYYSVARDITERKKTGERLNLLQLSVDNMSLGLTIANLHGVIIYTNRAEAAMHGYSPDELIGKKARVLAPFDTWKDIAMDGRDIKPFSRETTNITSGGRRFPVLITTFPVYDEQGEPVAIISLSEDLSEMKRTEEALKASEKLLREAQKMGRMGYWEYDVESGDMSWSEEIYTLYERPKSAGPPSLEEAASYYDEDTFAMFQEYVSRVRETGKNISFDYEAKLPSGRVAFFATTMHPINDDDGNVGRILGTMQDITERKKAEAAIRKTSESYKALSRQFNALLDAIPDEILYLSPEMEVLWANRAVRARAGNDVNGRRCHDVRFGSNRSCGKCPTRNTFGTGMESGESVIRDDRVLEVRAFPVKDEDGGVKGVIEVAADVTEKRLIEAQSMRAKQLASLGEMAAGVAHEINNPINGIINYARIMMMNKDLAEREREITNRIVMEGGRIVQIVKSLLSFAREDTGEKTLCSVGTILEDSLVLVGSMLKKNGINLQMDIPEGLPRINVRYEQIRQVFLNLINNARDALNQKYPRAHKDKVLEIKARAATKGDFSFMEVYFHDLGTGMGERESENALHPFYTTKPPGSGTGLGLSISHSIISEHDGILDIQSRKGEYTRVLVALPIGDRNARTNTGN